MTRFWWVRHAPTHSNAMVGWSDVPADLSDSARIMRLSAFLPTQAVIVSSDLARASATADAIAAGRTRIPDDSRLREFHFGEWELRRHSEIMATDPQLLTEYLEFPGDIRAPRGESWNEAATRVSRSVDRLLSAHSGADIILVSHFGAILTQIQRALGITASEACSRRIDNLSVTRIEWDGKWSVSGINHLA